MCADGGLRSDPDPVLHPRRLLSAHAPAGFTACEPCALTLGIPVYVPVSRAHAHTGTDAAAAVSRALAVCAAVAGADR